MPFFVEFLPDSVSGGLTSAQCRTGSAFLKRSGLFRGIAHAAAAVLQDCLGVMAIRPLGQANQPVNDFFDRDIDQVTDSEVGGQLWLIQQNAFDPERGPMPRREPEELLAIIHFNRELDEVLLIAFFGCGGQPAVSGSIQRFAGGLDRGSKGGIITSNHRQIRDGGGRDGRTCGRRWCRLVVAVGWGAAGREKQESPGYRQSEVLSQR